MTPATLAKSGTEHAHQTALFAYAAVAYLHGFDVADEWSKTGKLPKRDPDAPPKVPALEWFHAIPNGGSRGDDDKSRKIRGAQLKAEGVRQGVADTFLPWPSGEWHGLYIEMKKPTERPKSETAKGGVSDEQRRFGEYAKRVGYGWVVCYDWEQAASYLRSYIEWGS
ncbi:putative tRNA endonuclease-like domain protein [Pseudomonas phage Kopi]|uniref:tRNA endonuclease-like domain protein n=1 Tax=Pseudomonas phage Kopi TaxID=2880993 RepID=A0AAE8Y564_9CAUD|nr:putative tRNA endonuclease-like domain protein [Pseudomonas phage Kopi]UDF60312.1 putative tRNA endonuclease-like domain protein [Pseudomonas phage Kopi]